MTKSEVPNMWTVEGARLQRVPSGQIADRDVRLPLVPSMFVIGLFSLLSWVIVISIATALWEIF
jgi:hypothetical protein